MTRQSLCLISFLAAVLGSGAASAEPAHITLFSEAGFWGNRLDRLIYPTSSSARYYLIGRSDIENEGLRNATSSARLTCGDRGAQVYLSDREESSTSLYYWDGNVVFSRCEPGDEVEINLHTKNAYPSRATIADRVKSVLVIVDPQETSSSTVVTLFSEAGYWGNQYRMIQRGAGQPIYSMELYGLGLLYSLSSVRMECGSQHALLALYSDERHANDPTSGHETTLQCAPYQTAQFNLHNQWGQSGFTLGDAIRYLSLYTIY